MLRYLVVLIYRACLTFDKILTVSYGREKNQMVLRGL